MSFSQIVRAISLRSTSWPQAAGYQAFRVKGFAFVIAWLRGEDAPDAVEAKIAAFSSSWQLLPVGAAAIPSPDGRGAGVRGPCASEEGQAQLSAKPRQNAIEITADLFVGEANDADAHTFQHLGPAGVVFCEPFVLSAVEFNRELGRVTVKVDDVTVKGDLASELGPMKARAPQLRPKVFLGASRLLAQGTGELAALQ